MFQLRGGFKNYTPNNNFWRIKDFPDMNSLRLICLFLYIFYNVGIPEVFEVGRDYGLKHDSQPCNDKGKNHYVMANNKR